MFEDNCTEFKEKYSDSLVKSLIAFSNTKGGKIMIGVDDDGNVVGLEDSDDVAKRCVNVIKDKVRPDITMTTDVRIEQIDGNSIVAIYVHEGDKKPYYLREKGLRAEGVYIREGTSSAPVTEERFQRIMQSIRSVAFESQESFVQDLTFDALRSEFDKKMMTLTAENMESLHITHNGAYTQLGFILSDQYDQSMKAAAFNDEYRSEFLERAEFGGSIIKQISDALAFMNRYNRLSSVITGKYRTDSRAYPVESLREAVVNAVTHRDYSIDDPVLVSIYPDKMTITSPGTLNRNFTMDELLRGVSSLRNRNLAAVLYRLGYIEAYGTGIPRIFGSYKGTFKSPEITVGGSTFTITLPANDIADDPAESFLEGRDEFTRADLEEELNINKSEAVAMIRRMIEDRRIIKIGDGRSTRYRPNRPLRSRKEEDED